MLMMANERRRYSQEFKSEIVSLCLKGLYGARGMHAARAARVVRVRVGEAGEDRHRGGGADAVKTADKEQLAKLRRDNRELRHENGFLARCGLVLREGKEVMFAFIPKNVGRSPPCWMCRRLSVSTSSFYA